MVDKPRKYPYDFIEQWWGEPLSIELYQRISRASKNHLRSFENDLQEFDSDKLDDLSILPDGTLRPVLRSNRDSENLTFEQTLSIALNTLLYSHQIVMDSPLEAESVPEGVRRLLFLKPLVDAGSLHFGHVSSRSRHPSLWRYYDDDQAVSLVNARFPDLCAELLAKPSRFFRPNGRLGDFLCDVTNVIRLTTAMQGRATAMTCNDTEYKVITSLLHDASFDRKFWTLSKLTQMNVPRLRGKIDELVAIRQLDESFDLWREALSNALVQVQRIPDDCETWQSDANAMVFSELEPLRLKLQRDVSKSAVLSAMHFGGSKISIAGAGALTGWAVGGTFATALASSSATTVLESAASYFRAARARRQSKAILDIVLSFHPDSL